MAESGDTCHGGDRQCIRDALKTLKRYRRLPLFLGALHQLGFSGQAVPAHPIRSLRNRLHDKSHPLYCRQLLSCIDDLKMWGRQHVFLFLLSPGKEPEFEKLRDPHYLRNRLIETGLGNRFNNRCCIARSRKPLLSAVHHPGSVLQPDPWLTFQWVETRFYLKWKGNQLVRSNERSVSFLRINLEKGFAQLRIQSLPNRSLEKLIDIKKKYIDEMRRWTGSGTFSPIRLEPVMRQFLFHSILPITFWSIRSKQGDLQGNRSNPSLMDRLRLPFRNFESQEITCYWECTQAAANRKKLYFTMNSPLNSFTFNGVSDRSRVNFILNQFQNREYSGTMFSGIRMRELREMARLHPGDCSILISIDDRIRNHLPDRIDSGVFSIETDYPENEIIAVFHRAEQHFPHHFTTIENQEFTSLFIDSAGKSGWLDKIRKKRFATKPRRLVRKGLDIAGIPAVIVLRIIFSGIAEWSLQAGLQPAFPLDLTFLEILLDLYFQIKYYGIWRLRDSIAYLIRTARGKGGKRKLMKIFRSSLIAINEKEFKHFSLQSPSIEDSRPIPQN